MPDALVLAGGPPDARLAPAAPNKAFAVLCGRPMVEFVLRAFRAAPSIGRLACVAPAPLPPPLRALADVVVEARPGLLENVDAGLAALGGALGAPRVVAAAADVPLLTAEAVSAFVRDAEALEAEIVYGIVPRDDVLRLMPGARKTFVRVRDGAFTGGSLALLDAAGFARARPAIARAVLARKRPWELARLFGIPGLLGLVTGTLPISRLEARALALTGVRIRALVSRRPEIALDVDSPAMRDAVEAALSRRPAPSAPLPEPGLARR
jgi:molybdopterin-guanine dinucleotide biosynthesis protein A